MNGVYKPLKIGGKKDSLKETGAIKKRGHKSKPAVYLAGKKRKRPV